MTAFIGVVAIDGGGIDRTVEAKIVGFANRNKAELLRADGAIFAVPLSRAVGQKRPLPPNSENLLFAADAHLDNRTDLAAALEYSPARAADCSDSALLMGVYRRWGSTGIAKCLGAFSFAAWDNTERRLVLGRDYNGHRALFFHRSEGFVTFASELSGLLSLAWVPRELDDVAMAHFLALNFRSQRQTLYRGIERVPSRSLVTIDRDAQRHDYYWSPHLDTAPPYRRDEDYVERARELFDQAVATATRDTPDVAIMTSGGLDSSAVAATVARLGRAKSVTCFCVVPPQGLSLQIDRHRYLDERDKIAALGRLHPSLTIELVEEGDLHPDEANPTQYFARAGVLVRNPANLGAFSLATDKIAARRYPVAFFGDMGNFGLSWTGQFSLLALFRQGKIATMMVDLAELASSSQHSLARTALTELVVPGVPGTVRRLMYRLYGRDPDSVARHSCLNPAFVSEFGLTIRWREDGYDPWYGFDGWNPARLRAHYLFDHSQFARDTKAMSQTIFGFERRDPHTDRRLLEFLLTVPEAVFRRKGIARSFARAVLADRLPSEILSERRKGYQGSTWFPRLELRRDQLAGEIERLETSPLGSRLVDIPRLKRTLANWPKDADEAESRRWEMRAGFHRGLYVGRFIRWVEAGNS